MRTITLDEMKNRYNANKISELVGKTVGFIACLPYTDHDKNGKEYDQYLLATEDGTLYRTGSSAFYKSFVRLRELCEIVGYDVVTGTVIKKPTSNGYTVFVIE